MGVGRVPKTNSEEKPEKRVRTKNRSSGSTTTQLVGVFVDFCRPVRLKGYNFPKEGTLASRLPGSSIVDNPYLNLLLFASAPEIITAVHSGSMFTTTCLGRHTTYHRLPCLYVHDGPR